eukprot:2636382-Lingulodinium_polyedra.AAC.1
MTPESVREDTEELFKEEIKLKDNATIRKHFVQEEGAKTRGNLERHQRQQKEFQQVAELQRQETRELAMLYEKIGRIKILANTRKKGEIQYRNRPEQLQQQREAVALRKRDIG